VSQGASNEADAVTGEAVRAAEELAQMMREGRSFSGNERNCCFLNVGMSAAAEGRFANISAVSGLDLADDGRAVAVVDWDQDGDQDVWISNRNAPRLRLMRNELPQQNHFVALRLAGDGENTNRDAVGARVEVVLKNPPSAIGVPAPVGHPKSIRTLRAGEGFLAQSSKWLHFGLGGDDQIEKVVVHWPGRTREEFAGVEVNRRFKLEQGSGKAAEVPRRADALQVVASSQKVPPPSDIARITMVERLAMPKSVYADLEGGQHAFPIGSGRPLLVNLWASWCAPCLKELDDFSRSYDQLRAAGIELVALSVDGLDEETATGPNASTVAFASKLPFPVGRATPQLARDFQSLHDLQFALHRRLSLPSSFLIDGEGRLAVIYRGPVSIDQVLHDAAQAAGDRSERIVRSAPIAGTSMAHEQVARIARDWAAVLRFLLADQLKTSGRWDQAAAHYIEVLLLRPESYEVHNNLGVVLTEVGQDQEALRHYREAVRLEPELAEAHNNLGTALQAMGRHDEARSYFEEAMRLKPNLAEAQNSMGKALQKEGRLQDAATHFEAALRIRPGYAEAHYNLGLTSRALGRPADAIARFQRALQLDPKFAEAHYSLGAIAQASGRPQDAITHYQAAVRFKPAFAEAYNNLGTAKHASGRPEEAIVHYQKALRINPKLAEAHNNWGKALAALKRLEEAIEQYQVALRINPDLADVHHNFGNALTAAGRLDEAIARFREVIRVNPDHADAHNNLGVLLARKGRYQEAVDHLQNSVRLNPANQSYRNNLNSVQKLLPADRP